MKKIIFCILIMVSGFCKGQITIAVAASGGAASKTCNFSSTGKIATPTFVAGKLYLMVTQSNCNNAYAIPFYTLKDSFEIVGHVKDATGEISVFRWLPLTNHSGQTIGTFYSPIVTNQIWSMFEISNMQPGSNGANAIRQAVTGTFTSSSTAEITMASLSQRNAVIAFFNNNQNTFGGSVESGWTEYYDDGCNTATIGFYSMYRINTSDNTPSTSVSTSTGFGLAIEIIQSGHKPILITESKKKEAVFSEEYLAWTNTSLKNLCNRLN